MVVIDVLFQCFDENYWRSHISNKLFPLDICKRECVLCMFFYTHYGWKDEIWGNFTKTWNERWNHRILFLLNSVYTSGCLVFRMLTVNIFVDAGTKLSLNFFSDPPLVLSQWLSLAHLQRPKALPVLKVPKQPVSLVPSSTTSTSPWFRTRWN